MKAWLALGILLVSLAVVAQPTQQTWPIDAAHSQAQFSVRKFWIAHVRGTFPELIGTLHRIDTGVGAGLGRVDATLEVARLEMDDSRVRAHALSAAFFDAAEYPVIRFDSDPFPLAELVSGGSLGGLLTLHGERHPVRLKLQASDCPHQALACVIRVHGSISRSAFGMHGWRGVLSDKVELELRIKLVYPTPAG